MSPRVLLGFAGRFRRRRSLVLASYDAGCWVVAFAVMSTLNLLSGIGSVNQLKNATIVGVACGVAFVLAGRWVRIHHGRSKLGSFQDALLLEVVALAVAVVQLLVNFAADQYYRWFVGLSAPMLAVLLMLAGRGALRLLRQHAEESRDVEGAVPVVILGAGEAGGQLVDAMMRDPKSPWAPVALLDDDELKRHRRMRGVAVQGRTSDLARVAREFGADTAVVAIPSASQALLRRVSEAAREAGIRLKVLPTAHELLEPGQAGIRDVRDIDVADVLGRHQIETDVAAIAGYLTGKRVLVTGAGGSIGSELCRQIARFAPAELMMLDRDESALHAVQLSIHGRALLNGDDTVLADIRDVRRLHEVFSSRRPEVVFHAAALKHLPLLEAAPGEALKSNVWGTQNVLEAARAAGVERFVNISTDKAANPVSVLGYSKRLAEGLTAAMAERAEGTYLSVRFGNVLGSRGSVLTAFAEQIGAGGPVTVTDPAVDRYFMTVHEAVELVIQAGAVGDDGEILVLDMGQPVSIDAVARQLIAQSGKDVEIVYTGLRPGEKLSEELFGDGEVDVRRAHPMVSHTPAPQVPFARVADLDPWCGTAELIAVLREQCDAMVQTRFPEVAAS